MHFGYAHLQPIVSLIAGVLIGLIGLDVVR